MPFAQALHLRGICSRNNEFQNSCDKTRNRFIEGGYKQEETNKGIEKN